MPKTSKSSNDGVAAVDSNKSTFPAKWLSKLPEGWTDVAQAMSADDLKKKLVECERTISSTEKDMENDPKLVEAKEEAKALSGSYKEIINAHKAMVKYLVYVIDERGTP
ncbi:MAG TPA: hypothetical protein VM577_09080 [Anaerovoracaceae bacterium]|nr:hypothetical protein [Anaerovoracaceae bacterium]